MSCGWSKARHNAAKHSCLMSCGWSKARHNAAKHSCLMSCGWSKARHNASKHSCLMSCGWSKVWHSTTKHSSLMSCGWSKAQHNASKSSSFVSWFGFQKVTFQAVLVTDGMQSFAIFNYDPLSTDWTDVQSPLIFLGFTDGDKNAHITPLSSTVMPHTQSNIGEKQSRWCRPWVTKFAISFEVLGWNTHRLMPCICCSESLKKHSSLLFLFGSSMAEHKLRKEICRIFCWKRQISRSHVVNFMFSFNSWSFFLRTHRPLRL